MMTIKSKIYHYSFWIFSTKFHIIRYSSEEIQMNLFIEFKYILLNKDNVFKKTK